MVEGNGNDWSNAWIDLPITHFHYEQVSVNASYSVFRHLL